MITNYTKTLVRYGKDNNEKNVLFQGCVLFHWSNLLSRFRFPRCLHRSVLINITAKIFERQVRIAISLRYLRISYFDILDIYMP